MVAYAATDDYRQYIEKADNDDDIASFFVPLEQSYMGSLSFFQCGRGTFALKDVWLMGSRTRRGLPSNK